MFEVRISAEAAMRTSRVRALAMKREPIVVVSNGGFFDCDLYFGVIG